MDTVLRDKNLEAFRKYSPEAYDQLKDYSPVGRLVFDEDGNPDVELAGDPVYGMPAADFAEKQIERYKRDPNRIRMGVGKPDDYCADARPFVAAFVKRTNEEKIKFSIAPGTLDSLMAVSMGVGLAPHLDALVDFTDCRILLLADISYEMIYHSLSVYDWEALFKRMDERAGHVRFAISSLPEQVVLALRNYIRSGNVMGVDGMHVFVHLALPVLVTASGRLGDEVTLAMTGLGFIDDEIMMIRHHTQNFLTGNARLYLRPEEPPVQQLPVFIVGSGPSLDASLDYLKKNADRALILSCGSALRPLLKHGIRPDFQIETENDDILRVMVKARDVAEFSGIHLLATTTVDTAIPPMFDSVIYYYRESLTPYYLFSNNRREVVLYPYPTVTNAGLSFAQEFGFREFYFFGMDMGSKTDLHHSTDSFHYTKGAKVTIKPFDRIVPGNFGGSCSTNYDFFWARDTIQQAIATFRQGRRYYNCSDGALIEGAIAKSARTLELPDPPRPKKDLVADLVAGFPENSREVIEAKWSDTAFRERLDRFKNRVLDLLEKGDLADSGDMKEWFQFLVDTSLDDLADMKIMARGSIMQMLIVARFFRLRVAKEENVERCCEIIREEIRTALENSCEKLIAKVGNIEEEFGFTSKYAPAEREQSKDEALSA